MTLLWQTADRAPVLRPIKSINQRQSHRNELTFQSFWLLLLSPCHSTNLQYVRNKWHHVFSVSINAPQSAVTLLQSTAEFDLGSDTATRLLRSHAHLFPVSRRGENLGRWPRRIKTQLFVKENSISGTSCSAKRLLGEHIYLWRIWQCSLLFRNRKLWYLMLRVW